MRGKVGVRWDFVLFVMFLFLCSVSSTADLEDSVDRLGVSDIGKNENVNRIAGTPHSPIAIDGDSNFSDTALAEGWDGDGSEETPYIIEGLDIDLGGASGYCISINNTSVHFEIRNCQILGASINPFAGIFLNNATNGKIADSLVSNNYYGMRIWQSNLTSVINNTISENYCGIEAWESDLNTVIDNYCLDNMAYGLYYQQSESIVVANNTCVENHFSIYVMYGNSHSISNNTCTSISGMNMAGISVHNTESSSVMNNNCTGFGMLGMDIITFDSGNVTNNICRSNLNGMSVTGASFSNISNNVCSESSSTGLTLSSFVSGTAVKNTCNDNGQGLSLTGFFNNITENTCNSNTMYGIFLQGADSNNLTDNECVGNTEEGIYLYYSEFCLLIGNNCSFNTLYGIYAEESHNCSISSNTCAFNNLNGISLDLSNSNNVTDNYCLSNLVTGIYLSSSESNNIENNICKDNDIGIQLSGSPLNVLFNNTCESNLDTGILLSSSNECRLLNNTCSDNTNAGIHLLNSWTCIVSNDTISRSDFGLYLQGSRDATVTNNTFQECGLFLPMDSIQSIQVEDNTVNSRPLVFLVFQSRVTIPAGAGQIILISCWRINVENQNLSSCTAGLTLLDQADEIFVRNNIFADNYYGIYSDEAFCNVEENVFRQNAYGIYTLVSTGAPCGIYAYWNVFIDNYIENVMQLAPGPATYLNNYWFDYTGNDTNSDGFGDTPYVFPGWSDPAPLMYDPTPPDWLEPLVDQHVEYHFTMVEFQYDLNITSIDPMLWSLNSTLFNIDSDGVVTLDSYLPIGVYSLEVTVSNPYGNQLVGSFQIFIADITAPSWVSLPANQSLLFGEQMDIEISIIDLSGISGWELNDTINFRLTATYFETSSVARITSTTNLEPGVHWLMVTGFDIYDNDISAVFAVTVEIETTAPVWVLAPIDETVEYGEPYVQRLGAYDSSGIDHWWLNDTVHFTIDENGVVRNATVLEPGIYRLEVRAFDPYDNYCSATLVITVLDLPTTTTTTTTTTTSTTTTTTTTTSTTTTTTTTNTTSSVPGGPDPLLMLGIGGGVGAVAVLVIILFMKKKS